MKKLALVAMVVTIFVGCEDANLDKKKKRTDCSVRATLVSLPEDYCGIIFQLEDGQLIESYVECDLSPDPDAGPFSEFEVTVGKKVLIDYHDAFTITGCTVGKTVTITCLTEQTGTDDDL
jgi:hypothetical protein